MFDDRELSAGQEQAIAIHGAREHNLKNVSLTVPPLSDHDLVSFFDRMKVSGELEELRRGMGKEGR